MNFGLRLCILVLAAHSLFAGHLYSQVPDVCNFELDCTGVLNQHADQVGIWVNTNSDRLDASYIDALKRLKIRSLRYGWQFGLFDPQDLSSQIHSPRDAKAQGYLANDKGRMNENFGPEGVSRILNEIDATGFAVLNTDGINYIGNEDPRISSMNRDARIAAYAKSATEWASWAKSNRFQYFEIGNENDLTGKNDQTGGVAPWTAAEYAKVARSYLDQIKRVSPAAKCGINGGLLDVQNSKEWFAGIVAADPQLANDLDFVVAHKYEFWLEQKVWQAHADWEFGRLGTDYRQTHATYFPNLPIHVTELGSWKPGENTPHYRAVLATEMLGNIRMDMAVQHVLFWPTRWSTEGGVLQQSSNDLTGMGLGLTAYTRFAEPTMFANQVNGSIRCFASKGKTASTVWLINHSNSLQRANVLMKNSERNLTAGNALWRLESPTGTPMANDTVLREHGSVDVRQNANDARFSVDAPACSVTIIHFDT